MASLQELWARLPEVVPEACPAGQLLPAYRDGRLSAAELQTLAKAIKRRDKRYLKQLGYELD